MVALLASAQRNVIVAFCPFRKVIGDGPISATATRFDAVLPRPNWLLLPPATEMVVGPPSAVGGMLPEIVLSGVVRVPPPGPTTSSLERGACGTQEPGAGVPTHVPP